MLIGFSQFILESREDAEHWESSDLHRYVCGIAQKKGAHSVYFPEDDVIIKC